MLDELALPEGVVLVRTTELFTVDSLPAGLRRAHRVAEGVWGVLVVHAGEVRFVAEATGEARTVAAGQRQVIEPGLLHHVELSDDAEMAVEFHR